MIKEKQMAVKKERLDVLLVEKVYALQEKELKQVLWLVWFM